jgi:hypothetical protein
MTVIRRLRAARVQIAPCGTWTAPLFIDGKTNLALGDLLLRDGILMPATNMKERKKRRP